jgi:hypothetical protein
MFNTTDPPPKGEKYGISDLMALSEKAPVTIQKKDDIITEPYYYIYKNKVLFTVFVHKQSNMELVCQDNLPIPKYIHIVTSNEEIKLENKKDEFKYLKFDKSLSPEIVKNAEFIKTHGEPFFIITQFFGYGCCCGSDINYDDGTDNKPNDECQYCGCISCNECNKNKIWIAKITEGIMEIKVIDIVINKINNVEIYNCGFVRIKLSESENYLIKDSFENQRPFYEIFRVR